MGERAGFTPSLSPRFAAYVRDYLMDRGVNPAPVFVQCELDFNSNEEYDHPLPVECVARLFERAAEVTGNASMGLSMGQDFHYESSSLLIVAMLAAPSVGEGLRFLNQYDRYIDSGIRTGFYPIRTPAEFSAELLHEASSEMRQLNEYLMSFVVQTLGTATRQPVPLLEVTFQHEPAPDLSALKAVFNCQISFGAPANLLRFHPRYLDQPFLTSNKLLFRILSNAMDAYFSIGDHKSEFVSTVCRQMMFEQSLVKADARTIASRLNVSQRTLRRRLSEEGYSFQEAKNLARERRAKYLLANSNASLTEVAFEVGYSELSAFSRAFRGWVGETPQAYRENIRTLIH